MVFDEKKLNVGIRAVLNVDAINWEKAPQFEQQGRSIRFAPDLDLGTQYEGKHLKLGIGIKNVFANSVKLGGLALLNNQREAYINLACSLYFSNNFALTPNALVQIDSSPDFDLGFYLSLFRKLNVAYALRVLELRSIYSADVKALKNLRIGLAIDNSGLLKDKNLDVFVGYSF